MTKISRSFLTGVFSLLLLSMNQASIIANPLRAPDIKDNKLYFYCSTQMTRVFHLIVENKTTLPVTTYDRVSRLLMSAEIDSQLKKYPSCFNKLERARYYLQQAGLELHIPQGPDNTHGRINSN